MLQDYRASKSFYATNSKQCRNYLLTKNCLQRNSILEPPPTKVAYIIVIKLLEALKYSNFRR